jgi:hypothetical protein
MNHVSICEYEFHTPLTKAYLFEVLLWESWRGEVATEGRRDPFSDRDGYHEAEHHEAEDVGQHLYRARGGCDGGATANVAGTSGTNSHYHCSYIFDFLRSLASH